MASIHPNFKSSLNSNTHSRDSRNIYFTGDKDRRRTPRAAPVTTINKKYFTDLMAERELSLRRLAVMMGLNHSQLSLILSGKRKLQINEASQLSQIFGQPIHAIIEQAGVKIQPVGARRARVIGAAHSDGLVTLLGDASTERTTAPDHLPHRSVAVQMRSAGTPLAWMDGAIMFCREPDGIDSAALGRLCFVKIERGPTVIATVSRGYAVDSYTLSGLYTQESVKIEWASPVLFTRH